MVSGECVACAQAEGLAAHRDPPEGDDQGDPSGPHDDLGGGGETVGDLRGVAADAPVSGFRWLIG